MSKKIYHGDRYLEFSGDLSQSTLNQSLELVPSLDKGMKNLKKIIKDFTDAAGTKNYLILTEDFDAVLGELKSKFRYIEAAGGFIENEGRYLFIKRHGRWDLPKGKLEKNEKVEHCAVRECEEECGVKQLRIRDQLSSTFHVYPHKGEFALKQTYWFFMTTPYDGKLLPQEEEDISEVRWFTREEIMEQALKNTYYTITDVVTEGLGR